MAYEQNYINRYNKDDKKNIVAFIAETFDIGKEVGEYQSERMTLINRGVKQMLNQRRYLNWNSITMNSKEMMIDATIVENKDISNKTTQNEEGEIIEEMKKFGVKEKHLKMIMMTLPTYVS